jgi:hypothetical protein
LQALYFSFLIKDMVIQQHRFTEVLSKVLEYAKNVLQIQVIDTSDLDPYFKGDLDGARIWIASALEDDEELFNVIHLIGHSVQWNVSNQLRSLGSVLHEKPNDQLLCQLQEYEWEANCYGLYLLHKLDVFDLDEWLSEKYRVDMFYLTHYYKTGEKLKEITDISLAYQFTWPLVEKKIPSFVPWANPETRRGIVIDFTNLTKKESV